MWPQLPQPWYFNEPHDIAVAADGRVYVVDTGDHRVQIFSASGTYLGQWGRSGSGDGQFSEPSGIAIAPDGQVYVADSGNSRIQVFSASGTYLSQWGRSGSGDGQFSGLSGIATAPDGRVYVADKYNSRIQVFTADGVYLNQWGSNGSGDGQFSRPEDIAIAPDGRVYVADPADERIQIFSASGTYLGQWGRSGSGDGQFSVLSGIAIASDGRVYTTELFGERIQVFSESGTYLSQWGRSGSGEGQFEYPEGIAIAPDGRVYVTEAGFIDLGSRRVQVFSESGTYLNQWRSEGSGDGQFSRPEDIAIASNGQIYVADRYNDRIQVFSPSGAYLDQRGSAGNGGGQFSHPAGIAVAPDGRVYVADTDNNRIQVFNDSGSYLGQWGSYGSGDGEFHAPSGIAIAPDGRVYVADKYNDRIQVFSASGTYLDQWGSFGSGDGQLFRPEGITIVSDGGVYVADTANNRIQIFSASGTYLSQWGSRGSGYEQFDSPRSIAIASNGRVYVADTGNDRIQVFTADGIYIGAFGVFGDDPGQFNLPAGIVVTDNNSLYVTDSQNNRVQVFTRAEEVTVSGSEPPRALLIAGRTSADDYLDPTVFEVTLRKAYTALLAQGYNDDETHDEIRILRDGLPISMPSGNFLQTEEANLAHFSAGSELAQWAQDSERLLVYLIGHGETGYFYLNAENGQKLTAGALDGWLDLLQPRIEDDITVIYEACYAGSFLDTLMGPGRVLLSSSAADQRSVFFNGGLNSYSYSLWSEIYMGADLKQAHDKATLDLSVRRGNPQTPQLEANGNGVGNERQDLRLAMDRCIGIGVGETGNLIRDCHVAAAPSPQILAVAPERTLQGQTSAELLLELDEIEAEQVVAAWAVITRPDFQAERAQAFDQLPVVTLSVDPVQGKRRWRASYAPGGRSNSGETYQGFDVQGEYGITYYVKNNAGLLSEPMLSSVRQNQGTPIDTGSPAGSGVINISTRGMVDAGQHMHGGFVIRGAEKEVLIKGLGPSLKDRGVQGVLNDPLLRLYSGQQVIATSDDWQNEGSCRSNGLEPERDLEACIQTTLSPGAYTAVLSGVDETSGRSIVSVNDLGGAGSIINLSTRGTVNPGVENLTGGFVIRDRATAVLVKARGPSLADTGVANSLSDPTLTLYSGQTEIASNDDWPTGSCGGTGLEPAYDDEPCLLMTLAPGAYTAIVRSASGQPGAAIVSVNTVEN